MINEKGQQRGGVEDVRFEFVMGALPQLISVRKLMDRIKQLFTLQTGELEASGQAVRMKDTVDKKRR